MYAHRHEHSGNSLLAFVAGAATALAAGAYFLYGPDGKAHKRSLDRGMERLRRELLSRMNEVSDITQEKYDDVVDDMLKTYGLAKRLGKDRAAKLATMLKNRWEEMKDAAERAKFDAERDLWQDDLDDIRF
ncbi:MAG TPA: hypothetical protein VHD38_01895 [Candidatus Paceibacterota bacterium]|jgi:hypothetical protein|nr:hypothetical protein [Candidatus Paceibacterota bacterium]